MTMYRVRTTFTGAAVVGGGLNTLYFSSAGGTASQAVTAVATFWESVDSFMSNGVTWATEADVAEVDQETGELVGNFVTAAQTGSGDVSAGVLPLATQGLIRLRTGIYVAGREIRGRIFCPAPTVNQQDGGAPSATYRAGLDAAGAALVADANSTLMVWSRTNNQNYVVASASGWTKFAILRSRRD